MSNKALVKREDAFRAMAIASQNELTDAVTQFGGYVDSDGKAATSMKGLMLQVNKKIKQIYGYAREEMPRNMYLHVSFVIDRVVTAIHEGIKNGMSRREIKDRAYAIIEKHASKYSAVD